MDAGLEELSAWLEELKRRLHAFKWRMNASLEELEKKNCMLSKERYMPGFEQDPNTKRFKRPLI